MIVVVILLYIVRDSDYKFPFIYDNGKEVADENRDSNIDIANVLLAAQFYVGIITQFSACNHEIPTSDLTPTPTPNAMFDNSNNIIVKNLILKGGTVTLSINNSHHLWFDHPNAKLEAAVRSNAGATLNLN